MARMETGKVRSVSDQARSEGRSLRSVRLTLSLAWLAPGIVDAALDGRLPASIGATELARDLSRDWVAQRRPGGLT